MKDLILLHGALGASKELEPIAKLLQHDAKVHFVEFSGHGKTAQRDSFYIDQFGSELENYIREKAIKPVIFGYSMGGYVALNLLSSSKIEVEALITLGTKFDWNETSSEREAGFLDAEKLEQNVPQYAAYLKSLHGDNWVELLKNTKELMLRLGKSPLLNEENLQKVQAPVSICRGELDKMVSAEESLWASRSIQGANYIEFEGMKHPIHQIEASDLAEMLRKYL